MIADRPRESGLSAIIVAVALGAGLYAISPLGFALASVQSRRFWWLMFAAAVCAGLYRFNF